MELENAAIKAAHSMIGEGVSLSPLQFYRELDIRLKKAFNLPVKCKFYYRTQPHTDFKIVIFETSCGHWVNMARRQKIKYCPFCGNLIQKI